MRIRMQNSEELSAEQIHDFLKGTAGVNFVGQKKEEVYAWVRTQIQHRILGDSVSAVKACLRFVRRGLSRPAPQ